MAALTSTDTIPEETGEEAGHQSEREEESKHAPHHPISLESHREHKMLEEPRDRTQVHRDTQAEAPARTQMHRVTHAISPTQDMRNHEKGNNGHKGRYPQFSS